MRELAPLLIVVVAACGAGSQSLAERASTAASEGRWDDAYEAYARAVDDERDRLDFRRERVRAAHRAGRLPELEQSLRHQNEADGTTPSIAYELALVVATVGEPESDERALELLSQVARQLEHEGDVYFRMGLLRMEQERYETALEPLRRAVELDGSNARYRVALAAAFAQLPDHGDQAREALTTLPELEPSEDDLRRARSILAGLNNPTVRVPLGLRESYREAIAALSEEGASMGEAVQLIEEALETAPSCAPFIVLNGLASVRLGQLAGARAAFLRAVELWPEDPTPWLELAALEEEAGNFEASEAHLHRALEIDPLSLDVWTEIGRVRYQRRQFAEAAEAFTRLLAVDGGRLLTHLWLGRSLRRAGRDDDAEQVYLAMLDQHPRNFEACLQLGHIYRRRRLRAQDRVQSVELRERAQHYYRLALDIRPQDPLVQRLLGALEDSP